MNEVPPLINFEGVSTCYELKSLEGMKWWVFQQHLVVFEWWNIIISLKKGENERRKKGGSTTHTSFSHNASSSTQHDSNNQTRSHDLMRENDVWEHTVGPTQLGIWELKEDLHCFNETMPILCILLCQHSPSNGKKSLQLGPHLCKFKTLQNITQTIYTYVPFPFPTFLKIRY